MPEKTHCHLTHSAARAKKWFGSLAGGPYRSLDSNFAEGRHLEPSAIEICQRQMGEVDREDAVVDFQQADALAPQHFGEEYIVLFPAKMAVALDGAHQHGLCILWLRHPRRV